MNTILVFVTGILIRLIVPLVLTGLIIYILHRVDAGWQAQAEKELAMMDEADQPCWREQGFSAEEIKLQAEKESQPCWQAHRLSSGYLRDACLDCDVFLSAPSTVIQHASAHAHSHS
jgi:hypothetical protein